MKLITLVAAIAAFLLFADIPAWAATLTDATPVAASAGDIPAAQPQPADNSAVSAPVDQSSDGSAAPAADIVLPKGDNNDMLPPEVNNGAYSGNGNTYNVYYCAPDGRRHCLMLPYRNGRQLAQRQHWVETGFDKLLRQGIASNNKNWHQFMARALKAQDLKLTAVNSRLTKVENRLSRVETTQATQAAKLSVLDGETSGILQRLGKVEGLTSGGLNGIVWWLIGLTAATLIIGLTTIRRWH